MKMERFQKKLMWGLGEHFRRYAHALRFAIGRHGHGAYKFHPIVKYKHYQVSSEARAGLVLSVLLYVYSHRPYLSYLAYLSSQYNRFE